MKVLQVLIVLCCALFITIPLQGCGDAPNAVVKVATEKIMNVYIDTFVDDINTEDMKEIMVERRSELIELALDKYFNEESIQELSIDERIKQAVTLASEELLESIEGTNNTTQKAG